MAEVAVTYPLPGRGLERLRGRHCVRVHPDGATVAGADLAAFVGGADALVPLISNRVDASVFELCGTLRVVANVGVGFNNIDLDAARRAGVWVTNTPDVLTEATADLTWALILAVTRRVVEGDALLRRGEFDGWRPDFMLGAGLQGRTLGILGLGRIGKAVARRAAAFGMRVTAHDPHAGEVPAGVEAIDALEALLARADVLSVHVPLTPDTRRLLDDRRLRLLPHGAYVVNTSRGEVLDERALVEALESGHLAGAALDVYEREPEVHPGLLGRRDVVLLPHLGSATVETRTAMADLAVANCLAVLAGEIPPTPVVDPRESDASRPWTGSTASGSGARGQGSGGG
ncbi:MAG: D-glycerate dehydrogenase [Acidobacteriota bacterium]